MNYDKEPLKSALSSEYALGTLDGKARTRYQRLLLQNRQMRVGLWRWEQRLNLLGDGLPEQRPDDRVWQNIQYQLGFHRIAHHDLAPKNLGPTNIKSVSPISTKHHLRFISGFALAASIALAALVLWPRPEISHPAQTEQIAVVQGAKSEALWLIQIQRGTLEVQATHNISPLKDKDYELWMIAKDGRAPISLGLLPKNGTASLARIKMFDQIDIAALAVSLEPLGGSPNGSPTTVLYTTELVNI